MGFTARTELDFYTYNHGRLVVRLLTSVMLRPWALDHLLNEKFNKQNSTGRKYIYFQGMPRNLRGRGAQFKAKPAGPDVVKSKKKVITPADVQYSAQSQVKSKKRSTHPQIVLYANITFTPCICLRVVRGALLLDTPLILVFDFTASYALR